MSEDDIKKQILESVEMMHLAAKLGKTNEMIEVLPILLSFQDILIQTRMANHAITIH